MLELHQTKMAEEAAGVGRGPGPEDGARFLEELRDRATHELKVFRQALAVETRTALDEVGQLRDQKRTLQQELSELFAWKVRLQQCGLGGASSARCAPAQLLATGVAGRGG